MTAHQAMLFDLGHELKLLAVQAKAARSASEVSSEQRSFEAGRLTAFGEVISMMQQQARGLGIPQSEIRLEDFDPDLDCV